MCLGCGFAGMYVKFQQELSTPWHSKRCRRRTTWIRTILKRTPCSPRMGASFRANLARIRGETAKLRACQKVRTDRQTDSISSLYSRLANVPALSCRSI